MLQSKRPSSSRSTQESKISKLSLQSDAAASSLDTKGLTTLLDAALNPSKDDELADARAQLTALKSEMAFKDAQILNLCSVVNNHKGLYANFVAAHGAATKKTVAELSEMSNKTIEELQAALNVKNKVEHLKMQQLTSVNAAYKDLQSKYVELTETLNTKIIQLQSSLDISDAKTKSVTKELRTLSESNESAQKQVAFLQKELVAKINLNQNLERNIRSLSEINAQLKTQIEDSAASAADMFKEQQKRAESAEHEYNNLYSWHEKTTAGWGAYRESVERVNQNLKDSLELKDKQIKSLLHSMLASQRFAASIQAANPVIPTPSLPMMFRSVAHREQIQATSAAASSNEPVLLPQMYYNLPN